MHIQCIDKRYKRVIRCLQSFEIKKESCLDSEGNDTDGENHWFF